MSYEFSKLEKITKIRTGKLNSNAAKVNGDYPFFTCDPTTLRTNTFSFDTTAVLLAGNNASGNYTAKYFSGKFEVYQRTYVIESLNEDVLNVRYLSYAMAQELRRLKTMSAGSTTKFLKIGMLHNLEIPLPSIEDQRCIAVILSAYDDLIENNKNQIKLLEEAAMQLYKEWFVRLRFPGYEKAKIIDGVPEGWRQKLLKDCIEVNPESTSKNYQYSDIQYVDISSVNCGRIEQKKNYKLSDAPGRAKRLAADGDTIWGMVRPNLKAYALVLSPDKNEVFSTGFSVLSPKSIPYTFLYCTVTQDAFVGYLVNCTNGSAYPAVKPIHFEEAGILIPESNLLEEFHMLTDPMFRKIKVIEFQNYYLQKARDMLLPKLMSGDVEV